MQGNWFAVPPDAGVFAAHLAHVTPAVYNGGGENTFQVSSPLLDVIRHIKPGCGACPGLVPTVQGVQLTIPAHFCAWVRTWWDVDVVAQDTLVNAWYREPGANSPHNGLRVKFKFLNMLCLHVALSPHGADLLLIRRNDGFTDVQQLLPNVAPVPPQSILRKYGREIRFQHVEKFAHPDLFGLQHLLQHQDIQPGDYVECHSKNALCRMCDFVYGRVLSDLAVVLLVQVESDYSLPGPFRSRMPLAAAYPSWYELEFDN